MLRCHAGGRGLPLTAPVVSPVKVWPHVATPMYVTLGGQVVPRVYAPTEPLNPSMTTLCVAKQVRVNAFVSECVIHALLSRNGQA